MTMSGFIVNNTVKFSRHISRDLMLPKMSLQKNGNNIRLNSLQRKYPIKFNVSRLCPG